MKKLTFLSTIFALLAALLVSTPSFAKGPLPEGKLGVGASFASNSLIDQQINQNRNLNIQFSDGIYFAPRAQFLYTLSDQLQLDFGIGFQTWSVENDNADIDESASSYAINVGAKYFLGKVPYVGAELVYGAADDESLDNQGEYDPESDTFLMISVLLGGQVMVQDNLGIYGQVGLGYGSYTDGGEQDFDVTLLGLTTAAVGASFYFN